MYPQIVTNLIERINTTLVALQQPGLREVEILLCALVLVVLLAQSYFDRRI